MIDEETTARLLRLAGMRAEVPPDREDRVRRAVLDECRAVARARVVRRRMVTAAACSRWPPRRLSPFASGCRVRWRRRSTHIVATVERLEGSGGRSSGQSGSTPPARIAIADPRARRRSDRDRRDRSGRPAALGRRVPSIRLTGPGRASCRRARSSSARARCTWTADAESPGSSEVHTSFGVVRDIGTQFEIRLGASSLRVRVRSGVVEVHRGRGGVYPLGRAPS